MLDLYRNIRKRREELGMTQGQLAALTGYADKTMISKIEKGNIDLSQSKIIAFAEALQTTPRALMGWDEPDEDYLYMARESDINEIIAQNIRRLVFEKGKTQADVAQDLGLSKATLSTWMNGTRTPRMPKIDMLCNYFGVTSREIMEDHNSRPEGQDRPQGRKIPVVADVAAGTPIATWEHIIDWEEIEEQAAGDYYALRIRGDSMAPVISSGDVVIVRQQPDADTGDIVIAKVNGDESCCKRLIKSKDGITLQSLNPQYLPMFFNAEEIEISPVRILGKVVELRRKF